MSEEALVLAKRVDHPPSLAVSLFWAGAHHCRQGKRDAARAVLAPVHAWFTEGAGTRDRVEAKALLEDLG